MRLKRKGSVDRDSAKKLRAGSDEHYMSYVGPPDEYDLMGAMQFRLMTTLGLRETHTVLDFGCGSLRLGRLLIAYLEGGRYVGLEPNKWLIDEAIAHEVGRDMIKLKQPAFYHHDDFDATKCGGPFDFAIAQSIFSHSGIDVMETAIGTMAQRLTPTGVLLFTVMYPTEERPAFKESGWRYPKVVTHYPEDVAALLDGLGVSYRALPWFHLRQQWYIVSNDPSQIPDPRFDAHLTGGTLRVEKYAPSLEP